MGRLGVLLILFAALAAVEEEFFLLFEGAAAGEGERVRVKNRRAAGEGDAAPAAAADFLVRDLLRPRRPAGVSGRLFVIVVSTMFYYCCKCYLLVQLLL